MLLCMHILLLLCMINAYPLPLSQKEKKGKEERKYTKTKLLSLRVYTSPRCCSMVNTLCSQRTISIVDCSPESKLTRHDFILVPNHLLPSNTTPRQCLNCVLQRLQIVDIYYKDHNPKNYISKSLTQPFSLSPTPLSPEEITTQ